ncbi:MAG: EI24 domain-containing protein [Rhodospirillales bacterium]|nr:EI24 domain-containing protein [Rhodospirillales bacterium]MCW8863074.1 EI24 domain-containing protein [Rhodospirillales bacterium]MCW8951685.1 EI24 domain-containing protein [Rhodospirillales bacterium]MCW8971460.1 EI24 domain-containing protein [Rhodospirillales bacterium]MCW9001877.1 EI24 domain-containing protein [Rhodospirillales bacterium]
MISAFSKAVRQLDDPSVRRVVWTSVGASLLVFVALWAGLVVALEYTALFDIGWLETAIDALGWLAGLILTWLLFPAVVSMIMPLFLESVAEAVEARHYPDLGAPRPQPLSEALLTGVTFAAAALVLNVLVLPLYLVPGLNLFVFYMLNGYLLSREYFELVALRRVDARTVKAMRKSLKIRLLAVGALIAFLLTLPVVNLIAPVVATAAMLHLFEGWRSREAA